LEEQSKALQLVNWITDRAIAGVPGLTGSQALATEYLNDQSYASDDERIASLIRWESSKSFSGGFLSGVGGLITLPVALPAGLTAAWILQARMAGAIAHILGHDLKEDRVRSFVLLSLLGDAIKEPLKQVGVKVSTKVGENLVRQIPSHLIVSLNQAIGFRLITKAGTRGAINLTKVVPVLGGVVGGAADLYACRTVGRIAQSIFKQEPQHSTVASQPGPATSP
jgi:uncharacterized protein (DUF697 family)